MGRWCAANGCERTTAGIGARRSGWYPPRTPPTVGDRPYEWLDDESDALLLPASKSKTVGAQTWYFPSRSDCARCHTEAAGRTLGLEIGATEDVPADAQAKASALDEARANRDFAAADSLRAELQADGWIVETTKTGTSLRRS